MNVENPHRKHAWWRDYKERGIYMITIVVRNRERLFGELNMDPQQPQVILTALGQAVKDEWFRTLEIQRQKGRCIRLLGSVIMPDHFHGIIFVEEPMDVTLGEIVRSFKVGCTQARNRLSGVNQSSLTDDTEHASERHRALSHMSQKQRQAYYAAHPEIAPLFANDYDDTICFRRGQLDNIIRYVQDNPRRAILKRANSQLFRLHQQVVVGGFRCTTLGNQFLLDFPLKAVLQCSRSLNQEQIDHYKEQCLVAAEQGTIFVSAGVSEGEKQICKALREANHPIIIILKDGFPKIDEPQYKYYKPQGVYFETCAAGRLLLVEPMGELFDDKDIENNVYQKAGRLPHNNLRYKFLALNAFASRICE